MAGGMDSFQGMTAEEVAVVDASPDACLALLAALTQRGPPQP